MTTYIASNHVRGAMGCSYQHYAVAVAIGQWLQNGRVAVHILIAYYSSAERIKNIAQTSKHLKIATLVSSLILL